MKKLWQKFMSLHKVTRIVLVTLLGAGVLVLALVTVSYIAIIGQRQAVKHSYEDILYKHDDVLLVLGGGVNSDSTPKELLKQRLEAAIYLYNKGGFRKIIASGDNRFAYYNEPAVMKSYLVNKGIPENAIQEDFAGRSTYESCERAQKVFGLQRVVIVSQATHLARAIYLCKSFGLQAEGFAAADVASINSSQRLRELLANVKAVLNVYVVGENTVLGEKISL
jgi:vancomycin permeability regulator SanA